MGVRHRESTCGSLGLRPQPGIAAPMREIRSPVERDLGAVKHEWALLPLWVRRWERVKLHVGLTILAELSCAFARARGTEASVGLLAA